MMTHDCSVEPIELETKMTVETFEQVVSKPASVKEQEAQKLVNDVLAHDYMWIVFRTLLKNLIETRCDEVEIAINDVVTNHLSVDERLTVLLDIKLHD